MPSLIKVDIEAFRQTADQFKGAESSCRMMEDRIKSVTEDLLEGWTGSSKEAFKSKYGEIKKEMGNYNDMLEQISDELKKIADNYAKADEEIARKAIQGE